jgi:hypothetical protein
MTPSADRVLLWAPRALCLAFAAFISVFALDAFEPGASPSEQAAALAIHLIPTFTILGVLAVGWRRPRIAGVLLIAAGFWYAALPGPRQHLSWILAIAGPAWICGALFLLSGRRTRPREP